MIGGGRRDAVDRVHNLIVHMLRTCTVYMYIHPYMYVYTCTCVYQWSSVQTANHLGGLKGVLRVNLIIHIHTYVIILLVTFQTFSVQ